MIITDLIGALQAGKQLENSKEWKNAQATTNAIAAILAAVLAILPMVGFNLPVTHEQLVAIASGAAAMLGLYNTYTTVATSKTVGVPPRSGADGDPRPNAPDSAV